MNVPGEVFRVKVEPEIDEVPASAVVHNFKTEELESKSLIHIKEEYMGDVEEQLSKQNHTNVPGAICKLEANINEVGESSIKTENLNNETLSHVKEEYVIYEQVEMDEGDGSIKTENMGNGSLVHIKDEYIGVDEEEFTTIENGVETNQICPKMEQIHQDEVHIKDEIQTDSEDESEESDDDYDYEENKLVAQSGDHQPSSAKKAHKKDEVSRKSFYYNN